MSEHGRFGFRSLRFKLVLASIVIEGVMLAAFIRNSARITDNGMQETFQNRVQTLVPLMSASLSNPLFQRDYATLNERLKKIVQQDALVYLEVRDERGRIVAKHGSVPGGERHDIGFDEPDGVYDQAFDITLAEQVIGHARYGLNVSILKTTRTKMQTQGATLALIEIVLTFLLLTTFGYLLTRRLGELARAAQAIQAGDYGMRIAAEGRDEVAVAAHAFNAMAQTVERDIDARERVTTALRDSEQRLRSAHSTIEGLNKDLAQKVEDRTRELESVHRELVRKEKLSTLGQLTATVAHEMRNPLGTVRTAVFSIGDAIERNQPERVRRALLLAERNIRRCDAIIEDLLNFTRKKALKLTPVALDGWLEQLLSEQKVPDWVELRSTLVSDALVEIDTEYLRRAVINVMDNAVQALSVENPLLNKIHIETRVCDGRVEIRVSDTGPGIPTDILDRVFEPLFSTKTYGVGLGLPIVKDIMEEHHGGINIESSVGKGTTVTLWLLVIE